MGRLGIEDAFWAKYNELLDERARLRYGSMEYKEVAVKLIDLERQQIVAGNESFAELNVIDPLCNVVLEGINDDYTKEVIVSYIVWFKQNGFRQISRPTSSFHSPSKKTICSQCKSFPFAL